MDPDYSQVRPGHKQKPVKKAKYNKINQQKKFQLLNLIFQERTPIREAAIITGINHLTAKTIVFFYKNKSKSCQFQFNEVAKESGSHKVIAVYKNIKSLVSEELIKPKSRIEVICSIGNILSPPIVQSGRDTRRILSKITDPLDPLLLCQPTPSSPCELQLNHMKLSTSKENQEQKGGPQPDIFQPAISQ